MQEELPRLHNPSGEGLLIPRRPGVAVWSSGPETPRASALGRAVQAAVMGQRSLPAAGFLRGPGPCSWL